MGTYSPLEQVTQEMLARLALLIHLALGATGEGVQLAGLKKRLNNCLANQDNALNQCLKEMAENLKPFMKQGIPELNVPRTEPMHIDEIAFNLDAKSIGQLEVTFTNNTISGLSSHQIETIHADKSAKTISLRIFIPDTTAEGMYKMKGSLTFLDIDNNDPPQPYKSLFFNVTVDAVAKLRVINGKYEIEDDPIVVIDVDGMNIDMENLFGGKADLFAKSVLNFVNKDSQKFIKDFGPGIAKQVATF